MIDDKITTSSQIAMLLRINKQIAEMNNNIELIQKEIIEVS